MGRRRLSFISYNPFSDQRIDPKESKELYVYPELPAYIHDAVRRAKLLVGSLSLDEIKIISEKMDNMIANGEVYGVQHLNESGGEYKSAGDSDCLRSFLMFAKHDYSELDWHKLFGVLALSLAGEIVNTLWPSEDYIEEIKDEVLYIKSTRPNYDPKKLNDSHKNKILDFTIEAVRAVGFGEGLVYLSEFKKQKSEAGKRSPKHKEKLYMAFTDWAFSLPKNHGFTSTEDAVNIGFKAYLERMVNESEEGKSIKNLLAGIGETTHRRLKKHLELHCSSEGEKYPFPRSRSKN